MMLRKSVLLLVIFLFASLPLQASESSKIKWYDYTSGLEIAESRNKPIYLMFHSDSCSYCKLMDEKTFSDSKVVDYLNENFISVRVNGDKSRKIASLYKVRAYPASFFLKSNSDVIGQKLGYLDVKTFLKLVDFVNTEYSK